MAIEIFVVTGSNKGIGYGIVRALAQKLSGALIYLTARDTSLGEAAVENIKRELKGVQQSEIKFHQLDITSESSCKTFAEYLKSKHGNITCLINNAGIAFKNDATENPSVQADVTIKTNYYGTKLISQFLIPLIRTSGRLVNVASTMGVMKSVYRDDIIEAFKKPDLNVDEIDAFVEAYKKAAHEGMRKENGFPESAYRVSKAAVIALTMIQHREFSPLGISVNACCPGYVKTDMSSHKGNLTIEEGADTPVFLATDPSVPSGKFVKNRKPMEWL